MIRLETDANSDYHDPDDPTKKRLNVIVADDLEVYATSPISGGRFRIGVRAKTEVALGSSGSIRVELYRPGATTLSDERQYFIVEQPKPKEGERKNPFPQFRFEPVGGPEDENWLYVAGDAEDKDVRRHASLAEMTSDGLLIVYYSTAFPRFANERRKLEQKSPAMAQSFEQRYKLWLAVHALLKHEDEEAADDKTVDETAAAEMGRQERCRLAAMAAMMAAQEVKSGISEDDGDEAAVA